MGIRIKILDAKLGSPHEPRGDWNRSAITRIVRASPFEIADSFVQEVGDDSPPITGVIVDTRPGGGGDGVHQFAWLAQDSHQQPENAILRRIAGGKLSFLPREGESSWPQLLDTLNELDHRGLLEGLRMIQPVRGSEVSEALCRGLSPIGQAELERSSREYRARRRTLRMFLSYSRSDAQRSEAIASAARRAARSTGVVLKLFKDDAVRGGEDFERKIRREIGRCDLLLMLWGSETDRSDWQRIELAGAWILGKKVLVVTLPPCDPPRLVIHELGARHHVPEDSFEAEFRAWLQHGAGVARA